MTINFKESWAGAGGKLGHSSTHPPPYSPCGCTHPLPLILSPRSPDDRVGLGHTMQRPMAGLHPLCTEAGSCSVWPMWHPSGSAAQPHGTSPRSELWEQRLESRSPYFRNISLSPGYSHTFSVSQTLSSWSTFLYNGITSTGKESPLTQNSI